MKQIHQNNNILKLANLIIQSIKKMHLVTKNIFSFAKISFIGMGNMGFPMAINLAKKGHQVFGFDVDANKQQQAKNNNITFRKDIKQLSSDADIFVAMLPNSEHSKSVCQDANGIFQNAPKGSLILDCSTISPMVAIELNNAAKAKGMTYVDAPVSGGVTGAQAGTLTFMVGAETTALFDKSKEILQAMGKSFFNCQKPGAGQIAKLCNNMALAIEMIGISEALAMGAKLGMDGKILSDIMKVSSSRCWSVDTYNPVPGVIENVPSSRDYERGFGSELMLKDLKLAIEAAQSVNCKVELGQTSKKIYQQIVNNGMGRKDFGIIYDLILKNKA